MRFRSTNPVMKRISNSDNYYSYGDDAVSYTGVTFKTGILLAIIATISYYLSNKIITDLININLMPIFIVSIIGAFIFSVIAMRSTKLAPLFSILYAGCEGVVLGVIIAMYSIAYDNVVIVALTTTFGIFAGMLVLYSTGLFRVSSFFRRFMYTALLGLLLTTFLFWILNMLGALSLGNSYMFYVVICCISAVIASFYLLISFDDVSRFVDEGAHKSTEWLLAVGLVVSIVWLFIEILRLVSIFKD